MGVEVEFDSYIIPQNEIENDNFRLLDVDNRAALPINTFIRIIITATDFGANWIEKKKMPFPFS